MEKPREKSKKKGKQKKNSSAPLSTNVAAEKELKNAAEETEPQICTENVTDNGLEDVEIGVVVEEEQVECKVKEEDDNTQTEIVKPPEVIASAPALVQTETIYPTELLASAPTSTETEANYEDLNRRLQSITMSTVNISAIEPLLSEAPKEEKVKITAYTESQLSALYTNSELDNVELFTLEFVEAELKGLNMKQHPLYQMLSNYLQVRAKLQGIVVEINEVRKECESTKDNFWTLQSVVISERATCIDGNVVKATLQCLKATINTEMLDRTMALLKQLREAYIEEQVFYGYMVQVVQIKIQMYVDSIVATLLRELDREQPIHLGLEAQPPHLLQYICDLRLCISIIFHFQRLLNRDSAFLLELRKWLSTLVRLLLRFATWQDHLFIINHILRCPGGISWASEFVQIPLDEAVEAPFSNYAINHLVSILALILMPVQSRDKFLEQLCLELDDPTETLWVLVDSDGEEDEEDMGVGFRENDLVALLNQIPLENLFRNILLIRKRDNKNVYDVDRIDEGHILRFFSFCTCLMRILHRGLRTYDQNRYIQFCKRLSRLIRHVVQYATDQWESFLSRGTFWDPMMMERLQVEYDAFFLRAIYYLYTSVKLGAWQFLAVVPFGAITERTLWKIFFFLHDVDSKPESILDPVDTKIYNEHTWILSALDQFEEKLISLPEDECYYLLNTFANMALSRKPTDMTFIKTATLDLLKVGYFVEATQETCAKNARILLTHITSKYPHLLSNILRSVRENSSKIGSLSLFLYEELPLSVWRLTDDDIETLSYFILQNPLQSNESKLGRMIISRLNWGLDANDKLFLPYVLHCKIALMIAMAVEVDTGYAQWAWQTAFRLHLHMFDKAFSSFQEVKEVENYDIIFKGVRRRQPLACFLSVVMMSYGHHVPQICSHGLDQLLVLQANQKHEAILFALNLIIPLFINCQESLINLEKYQKILQGLLNADRSYTNLAKSLLMSVSGVLEQFGNMIQTQIGNYKEYGLESPRYIARLWVNSLVSVPNWNQNVGAIYLLDVIVKASFIHKDTMDVISGIFKDLLQCSTPEQTTSIGSLFKWAGQGAASLLINVSLATYPYLAYVIIGAEFDERERSTGLWYEVLVQLKTQKKKVSVDSAIRAAATKLKVPWFSSASLSFFRWAQLILDTPSNHPILVLLWQKFFCLYLCRILQSGGVERGCVGEKFFEGVINFAFLKKLKNRLAETLTYFQSRTTDEEFAELSAVQQLVYMENLRVFTAYSLWLEEPRLQDATFYLSNLPPKYEVALLNLVVQFSDDPWMEYVDYEQMKKEQAASVKAWSSANYREKKNINLPLKNAGSSGESDDPVERMFRRLESYDAPKKAAKVEVPVALIQPLKFESSQELLRELENKCFGPLKENAHSHRLVVSDLRSIDNQYKENILQLYRNELRIEKRALPCRGIPPDPCNGPAIVVLQTEEAKKWEEMAKRMLSNRENHDAYISKLLNGPSRKLCLASVTLQHAVKCLEQLRDDGQRDQMGSDLFNSILKKLDEEALVFSPVNILFKECLKSLGKNHIQGNKAGMPQVLKRILEDPENSGVYLIPHFSPSSAETASFLEMYHTISENIGNKYDLRYNLLSKFNVLNWLHTKRPKLSERSQFIQLIMKTLLQLGQAPAPEALCLHAAYRIHLVHIFEYQFPEHYGEIFMHILKASSGDSDCIAINVWMDMLNSLARPVVWSIEGEKRDLLRNYAQNQQFLHYQELLDTAVLLHNHFANDRFQYGLYGLYPKTSHYIDVIVLFLGMCGHALIVSAINTHQGALGDQVCDKVFPYLRDMFNPWLVPYPTTNVKENMASWIQQLTDDRQVLLPWISSYDHLAKKSANMFFECVLFLAQALPASNNILSSVWVWYVSNFAHETVKEHIVNVIHQPFLGLPWQRFWPSVSDIELMVKVIDQYLPECHVFLGHIFVEVPWRRWMKNFNVQGVAMSVRVLVLHCLLNLLVKLSNEPSVRTSHGDRLRTLLSQFESDEYFDWSLLPPTSLRQIFDWYVQSCEPTFLFRNDPLNLDCRIIQFLKVVSFYRPVENHTSLIREKREIFIQSYMKIIAVFTGRHKMAVPGKEAELVNLVKTQLNDMESLMREQDELEIALAHILTVLNLQPIRDAMIKCFEQWLSSREGDGMAIKGVLRIAGETVFEPFAVATIYETAIETYFYNNVANFEKTSWTEVCGYLRPNFAKLSILMEVLISKGCILTLHVLLLQKKCSSRDFQPLLNLSLHWLQNIKITALMESKVPLIWADILDMCLTYCHINQTSSAAILYKFSKILLQISDQRDTLKFGGILNAIGIGKTSEITLSFKFLCRAVAGYVLAQLPDSRGNPQTVRIEPNAACTVGQTGGNTEVPKWLLKLDFGQSQGKIKDCAEQALKSIQEPKNSLHNVDEFLFDLLLQLYTKPYLKGITKS